MAGEQRVWTAEMLRDQAARCRRLADGTTDRDLAERLLDIAREFEEQLEHLEDDRKDE